MQNAGSTPFDRLATGVALALAATFSFLQSSVGADLANRDAVARLEHEWRSAWSNNPSMLVRPGLLADRASRTVRVLADSTGLGSSGPVEFILIGPDSSHAYEALAVSHASPGDVYDALRFIGMTPGRSPDLRALAFWPKGERVLLTLAPVDTDGVTAPVPVESLLLDTRASKTPAPAGLVFVEAGRAPESDSDTNTVYIPDAFGPRSIAPTYNEPQSVFDVPRMAPQGSAYGTQLANPAALLPTNALVEIVMRPERTGGTPRVLDLALSVVPGPTVDAPPGFCLGPANGDAADANTNVLSRAGLAQAVAKWVREGRDPFVTIRFDGRLSLAQVHDACRLLEGLEREDGIRVDPPPADQLYFRAFIPDEENRRREDRVEQPWELHLKRGTNGTQAVLTQIEVKWHEDRDEPELRPTDYPLATPGDIWATLDRLEPGLPVMLIFADPGFALDEVMRYVTPVRRTHGIIHVYLDPAAVPVP